jgi:TolB-like protein
MSIQQANMMTIYDVKKELGVEQVFSGEVKTHNGKVYVTPKSVTEKTDKGMWTFRKHEG